MACIDSFASGAHMHGLHPHLLLFKPAMERHHRDNASESKVEGRDISLHCHHAATLPHGAILFTESERYSQLQPYRITTFNEWQHSETPGRWSTHVPSAQQDQRSTFSGQFAFLTTLGWRSVNWRELFGPGLHIKCSSRMVYVACASPYRMLFVDVASLSRRMWDIGFVTRTATITSSLSTRLAERQPLCLVQVSLTTTRPPY